MLDDDEPIQAPLRQGAYASCVSAASTSGFAAEMAGERAALVATLRLVGPDAPTLAGDWNTQDLAAHVAATVGRGTSVRLAAADSTGPPGRRARCWPSLSCRSSSCWSWFMFDLRRGCLSSLRAPGTPDRDGFRGTLRIGSELANGSLTVPTVWRSHERLRKPAASPCTSSRG